MAIREPQHRCWRAAWLSAAGGVVLVVVVILSPRLASAESLLSPTVAPGRVAEVNSSEQSTDAPPIPDAKSDTSGNTALGPAPSPHGLDSHAAYRALIEKEVAGTGLAPDIAEAVMEV